MRTPVWYTIAHWCRHAWRGLFGHLLEQDGLPPTVVLPVDHDVGRGVEWRRLSSRVGMVACFPPNPPTTRAVLSQELAQAVRTMVEQSQERLRQGASMPHLRDLAERGACVAAIITSVDRQTVALPSTSPLDPRRITEIRETKHRALPRRSQNIIVIAVFPI